MSAEEWRALRVRFAPRMPGGLVEVLAGDLELLGLKSATGDMVAAIGKERHPVAALALNGAPFGFSWNDVDVLRSLSVFEGSIFAGKRAGWRERQASLSSLADRIAALLPPRT
jgi:hypothetical protein